MSKLLTTVSGVEYPDGSTGACYAYIEEDLSVGVALPVKRAIEMQREGVPYEFTGTGPEDYGVWYAPDFPPIGAVR